MKSRLRAHGVGGAARTDRTRRRPDPAILHIRTQQLL
jgi:hypothetical protein